MKRLPQKLRTALAALTALFTLSAGPSSCLAQVAGIGVDIGALSASGSGAGAAAGSAFGNSAFTAGAPSLTGAPALLASPAASLSLPNREAPSALVPAAHPAAAPASAVPAAAAPALPAPALLPAASDGPKAPAEEKSGAEKAATPLAAAENLAGRTTPAPGEHAGDPQVRTALDGYFDQSTPQAGRVQDPIQHTADVLAGSLPENIRSPFDPAAGERQRAALKAWHDAPRRTYVLVNSYSFKDDGTPGLNYYDMRPLAQILWAADPKVDVIFVTAMPVDESMIRHVLQGHPNADEIRKRVHFVSLNDAGTDFLSQKLLDAKHASALTEVHGLIERIGAPAALYPYMGGPYEWRIAHQLGIPDSVYAAHPSMIYWGTKSGGRKIFKAALARYTGTEKVRVKLSAGAEDLYDADSAADALGELLERHPDWSKVAVKLNLGSSGEGNYFPSVAGFREMSVAERRRVVTALLRARQFGVPDANGRMDTFADALANEGAAIEEFIPGIGRATFPSVQSEILPDGTVRLLSSHEQILIDGNNYIGANLAANEEYREVIERAAFEAATELAKKGIVGRFGTDFAVIRQEDGSYDAYFIENNIRLTGTTHPLVAASGLTGAAYDSGVLRHPETGETFHYKTMDHDVRPNLVGMGVDGFLAAFDRAAARDVLFNSETKQGVMFHLVPAVKPAGNVGYTIIARTARGVAALQKRLSWILNDLEIEHLSGGEAPPPLNRFTSADARDRVEAAIGHAEQVKRFRAFLGSHPDDLYRRGSPAGIVFHPHGFSVLGRSPDELASLETRASELLEEFAAGASKGG